MSSVKKEWFFIVVLVVLALVMRFWNFRGYLTFLDDQGRDALVAKHILIDHDITLLGPVTSVGNMYLGPLYYYAMVPFLAMTYPDPTGPAYAIALLGVVTVVLIYVLGKRMVGKRAAALAALLCAVVPSAVQLSRFSWQPNPAPFVGLLMLWWSIEAVKGKTWRWFWVGVCFAILVQLHYVALLSILPAGILFIYDFWKHKAKKGAVKQRVLIVLAALAVFVLSQLPLVVFDLRHDGLIHKAFVTFIRDQGNSSPVLDRVVQFLADTNGRGMFILIELLGFSKEHRDENTVLLVCLVLLVLWQLVPQMRKKNPRSLEFNVIAVWVGSALVALTIYRHVIYVHYFAYLFPAIFLIIGSSLNFLAERLGKFRPVVYVAFMCLVGWNVITAQYWKPKTADIDMFRQVARDMLPNIGEGTSYNVALLNDNREYRAMKYRYFFEVIGPSPMSQYDYDKLEKLVVITENGESPLDAPIFEIQRFVDESKQPKLVTTQTYQDIVHAYLYERE